MERYFPVNHNRLENSPVPFTVLRKPKQQNDQTHVGETGSEYDWTNETKLDFPVVWIVRNVNWDNLARYTQSYEMQFIPEISALFHSIP